MGSCWERILGSFRRLLGVDDLALVAVVSLHGKEDASAWTHGKCPRLNVCFTILLDAVLGQLQPDAIIVLNLSEGQQRMIVEHYVLIMMVSLPININ